MKQFLKFSLVIFALCFLSNCKSKINVSSGKLDKRLSAKELIKSYTTTKPKFKTLSSRVKLDIIEGEKSKGYTVNLRMEKDKKILLSSTPITVVKCLITPNRVAFYNKLDGTYFDGDFTYLSKLLGIELDYKKVQNILLGETIYDVNAKDYSISLHEKSYVLTPKNQTDLLDVFFLFNPKHFKPDSQQISQTKESRFLEINYLEYQDLEKQKLPEVTQIIAVEGKEEMKINLGFKSLTLNESLRFPFKIPQGYKKINLE